MKKITIIANGHIPTTEIAFLNPLQEDVENKKLQINFITEAEIKERINSSIFRKIASKFKIKRFTSKYFFIKQLVNQSPDLIIFSRYSGPYAEKAIQYAKRYDIKTILYMDDNLIEVPMEIGEQKYKYHSNPTRVNRLRMLLREVDKIYSSTKELTKFFIEMGIASEKIVTEQIFCPARIIAPPKTSKTIGYMGFGHQEDFKVALPGLVRFLENNPDFRFEIFGTIPLYDELKKFEKRIKVIPPVSPYSSFISELNSRNWLIGICPLADFEFNKYKANTKWVEYSALGSIVVASDHVVYHDSLKDKRGILVKNQEEWFNALQWIVDNPDQAQVIVRNAQRHIDQFYTPLEFKKQLLALFNEVNFNI